jgi:hypothetical protein
MQESFLKAQALKDDLQLVCMKTYPLTEFTFKIIEKKLCYPLTGHAGL